MANSVFKNMGKSPMMMLGLGLFFILVGATGYRILIAINTHPGLVVSDPYQSGEQYHQTLAHKQQLSAQGWTLQLKTPKNLRPQIAQIYRVISQQNKVGLTEATVKLYFYRPLESKSDFVRVLQSQGAGHYQAQITLPLKGRWDVVAEVVKGDFLQRSAVKLFAP